MSETDKGVLIYTEWFDAMENLSPKDFKAFIYAMYNYQIHDVPPPEFKGKSAMISSVVFPYIKRRKQQSARGKLGVEATATRLYRSTQSAPPPPSSQMISGGAILPSTASSQASSTVDSTASSTVDSTASSQRIEENSVAENRIAENNLEERSVYEPSAALAASAEEHEVAPISLALAEKQKGYGVYGNVFLSTEEYLLIKNTIDDAEKYIDNFSAKLYAKGYRYPNHAQAILDWWKKDSRLPKDGGSATVSPTTSGSFDAGGSFETDRFFEAAVKRSLGEG